MKSKFYNQYFGLDYIYLYTLVCIHYMYNHTFEHMMYGYAVLLWPHDARL